MTTDAREQQGVGFRSERGAVLIAVMLSTGLVALDSTIIATAVPSVVSDLGGFAQYPWLFSIYLLTQAATVPLYGRYADLLGRRPVLFFGIGVFLLGSTLCGFAWNMISLIAFRGLQGIGAGAVIPISVTIIGDIYSVAERARVQGYTASVWGAASVLGPTLGGVLSQYATWRMIFFVNLPVGALAVWMLARNLHESLTRRRHRIDALGAVLLTGGCTLLILGLLEGGVGWPWLSPASVAVFVLAVALIVGFVFAERHAPEPVLPLWIFRHRTLVGANIAALAIGAILIGFSAYIPTFAQGVLLTGPLVAGFVLATQSVGWPLASSLSGRLYLRIGFRDTALIGTAILLVGTVLCLLLPQHSHLIEVAGACFVTGAGLGLTSTPVIVAVQSVVGWERRGVLTGTNMFFRSVGSAVGAAIFGAIANTVLLREFGHPPASLRGRLPHNADATSLVLGKHSEPSPVAHYIRSALFDATHSVFVALAISALCVAAAVVFMPRRTQEIAD